MRCRLKRVYFFIFDMFLELFVEALIKLIMEGGKPFENLFSIYRVSFLTGPASPWAGPVQKYRKNVALALFYRSTFTSLVGILPSSTLRTFKVGTSQKRRPVVEA